MTERCVPVKVGEAAEVEALIREHASPVVPSAEVLELAKALAAMQYGDTPEHVAVLKASNPAWDETRGNVPLARALLSSEWFASVKQKMVEEALAPVMGLAVEHAEWYASNKKTISVDELRARINAANP